MLASTAWRSARQRVYGESSLEWGSNGALRDPSAAAKCASWVCGDPRLDFLFRATAVDDRRGVLVEGDAPRVTEVGERDFIGDSDDRPTTACRRPLDCR